MDSIAVTDQARLFIIPLVFLVVLSILVVVGRTRNRSDSSSRARILEILLVAITSLGVGAFVTLSLKIDPPVLPVLNGTIDFKIDSLGFKYVGRSDDMIDSQILYFGAYEKPLLFLMRDVMKSRGSPGIFLDVGANTGQHSLFMSKYSREVHAFEPYAPVRERFLEMISINQIENIQVHPVGLGNERAVLPFYEPPTGNLGMGSFAPGFLERHTGDPQLELEIVAGDAEFEKLGIATIDLIKMDIEGYEKPAIEGMSRVLAAHRPIVVMELSIRPHHAFTFKSMNELKDAFPEGYDFYVFDKTSWDRASGDYTLNRFEADFDDREQHDLVVCPIEKTANIPLTNLN